MALVLLPDLPQICIQMDEVIMYVASSLLEISIPVFIRNLCLGSLGPRGNRTPLRGQGSGPSGIPAAAQHGRPARGAGSYF